MPSFAVNKFFIQQNKNPVLINFESLFLDNGYLTIL